jgi:hypothetical protein
MDFRPRPVRYEWTGQPRDDDSNVRTIARTRFSLVPVVQRASARFPPSARGAPDLQHPALTSQAQISSGGGGGRCQ